MELNNVTLSMGIGFSDKIGVELYLASNEKGQYWDILPFKHDPEDDQTTRYVLLCWDCDPCPECCRKEEWSSCTHFDNVEDRDSTCTLSEYFPTFELALAQLLKLTNPEPFILDFCI